MQKEHSLELNKLGWVALGLYLFFQVLYFKDDLVNVVKITAAQLYLFILPGFALMFQFRKKIDFVHRLLIGTALGYAASILLTIYLNVIFKTNISNLYWISPLVLITLGLFMEKRGDH